MFTALLSGVLLVPAAPVPKDFKPTGPAPYALTMTADADGVLRVVVWPTAGQDSTRDGASFRDPLVPLGQVNDLRITTAEGVTVSLREALKLIAAGTPAVASMDGKPVGEERRRALARGTLVFVSPALANRGLPLPKDMK